VCSSFINAYTSNIFNQLDKKYCHLRIVQSLQGFYSIYFAFTFVFLSSKDAINKKTAIQTEKRKFSSKAQ